MNDLDYNVCHLHTIYHCKNTTIDTKSEEQIANIFLRPTGTSDTDPYLVALELNGEEMHASVNETTIFAYLCISIH